MLNRVLNAMVGSALLALSAPLFTLIAALIKVLGGPGPVFCRQQRISSSGTPFLAWHFRVQRYPGLSDASPTWDSEESRPTPVGAWLRRYHLDEFPKLINVVLGDIGLLDIVQS